MRIAITSDGHLGDPNCTLVTPDLKIGTKFNKFKEAVGQGNDYLILLGDFFDFSVCDYSQVYKIAKVFLNEVRSNDLAKEIIFVPGNHDFEFWHILEHQVNIIDRIKDNQDTRCFRWSVPGIIDDRRTEDRDKFNLPDVTTDLEPGKHKYGKIFLSDLVSPPLIFNVAYPNIYFITKEAEVILLTHGQYLEFYWAFLGEWAQKIMGKDLVLTEKATKQITLQEMVAFNFPQCQLSSSGVGQAGSLTDVMREIQKDKKDHNFKKIKKYLKRFDEEILDEAFDYPSFHPYEWGSDLMISLGKRKLIELLSKGKNTRYNKDFFDSPEVKERFNNFYRASLLEIERLNKLPNMKTRKIPKQPERVIFGHTHDPIPWEDKSLKHKVDNVDIYFHNAGGWLTKKEQNGDIKFVGASVFIYETGRGFKTNNVLD